MKCKVDFCRGDCDSCNHFSVKDKNDGLVAIKKKVTSHYIAPDLSAIKYLIDYDAGDDYSAKSDDELIEMMNKLLKEIKNETKKR